MRFLNFLALGMFLALSCSVSMAQTAYEKVVVPAPQNSETKKPEPPPTKRLFIADYVISGAIGSAHTDSSGNTYGSAAGVGRNITLEATDGFMKHCPAVTVTNDKDAADYILRPNKGSSSLYKKNGDVVYVSHARVRVSNLVKDVCGYIQSHP